ncbi:hypothetical protein BM1_02432 [Bipolaris maydis]|nr:hypothetical protein BM1_02432 [Bipolaris maydis]
MAQFNASDPHPMITLKKDAPKEELDAAKKKVTDQGGKIINEFTLIKGFTYVHTSLSVLYEPDKHADYPTTSAEIPDDVVSTLKSSEHVTVETDAEVRTQ